MILQVLLWIEHDMLQAFGEETDKKKKGNERNTQSWWCLTVFSFFLSVCVWSHFSHIGSFLVFLIRFFIFALSCCWSSTLYSMTCVCAHTINNILSCLYGYSGGGSLYGYSTPLAALFVHRFRHPLLDYAHHQRVPLFGHDLLLFKDRSHRKRAQHHRRVWPLSLLARIAIRIKVYIYDS